MKLRWGPLEAEGDPKELAEFAEHALMSAVVAGLQAGALRGPPLGLGAVSPPPAATPVEPPARRKSKPKVRAAAIQEPPTRPLERVRPHALVNLKDCVRVITAYSEGTSVHQTLHDLGLQSSERLIGAITTAVVEALGGERKQGVRHMDRVAAEKWRALGPEAQLEYVETAISRKKRVPGAKSTARSRGSPASGTTTDGS